MTRIAAIGEAMIELSIEGETARVGVAGDTLNTAIYLKRAAPGLSVDYITCLGDDPFSDRIETFISAQRIGTDHCKRLIGRSPGLYAITTSAQGERSFTYWRSASAARSLFEAEGGYKFDLLADYDLIYLSGISVAILPAPARAALLEWLNATPIKLAYDSNYRPRLWESASRARETTKAFWDRADILLPSIDDEMALFEETAEHVEARLRRHGRQGALKRGAQGPVSLGEVVSQEYAPAPSVVDTTAAGDSFNGAYLAAHLCGAKQKTALLKGHETAAQVVQHRGAIIPQGARV